MYHLSKLLKLKKTRRGMDRENSLMYTLVKLYQKSASKGGVFCLFLTSTVLISTYNFLFCTLCPQRHQNSLLFLAKTMKTLCSLLTRKRESFIFRWRRQFSFPRSFIIRRRQNGTIYNYIYICKHKGCC